MTNAILRQTARKSRLRQTLLGGVVAALLGVLFLAAGARGAAAQAVDWVINLSDTGSDPTPAGGLVDYQVTVANDGFAAAPATTLSLAVPAGATMEAASGAITDCAPLPAAGPATVLCPVPPLDAGASIGLVAHLRSTAQGTIGFAASVPTSAGATTDSEPGNNAVAENTSISPGADIGLTVTGPSNARSGRVVTYGFVARNNGPDPASNIVLAFPVPPGLVVTSVPSGCTLSAGAYRCAIAGPVAAGATETRSFQARIVAASGQPVTPAASIGGGSPVDPVPQNDSATMATQVEPGSDLTITQSRAPGGTILVGQQVTFTLTAAYNGDSPQGITVTDTLPGNFSIVSVGVTGMDVNVAGRTVTATRTSGGLAGANVPLGSISIVARAETAGSVNNTAQISAVSPDDPTPANNTASSGNVTIQAPQVDLQADMTGPWPAQYVVGHSYPFYISASNVGNTPFSGTIQMVSDLPEGMQVTGISPNGWSCTPATPVAGPADVICQRTYSPGAPLAAGASTPLVTLTTQVTQTGEMTNGLKVKSDDLPAEQNPANNIASHTGFAELEEDSADVRVIKTATAATVASGDELAFVIEVVNDGPAEASMVWVLDELTGLIDNAVGPDNGLVRVVPMLGNATGLSCDTAPNGSNARNLTCLINTLPVCNASGYNDCPSIAVIVRPGGNAGPRTNTATVVAEGTPDPVLSNKYGSVPYSVTAQADVAVSKVANPSTPTVGQAFDYVITARNLNNGMSQAQNVTITDTLPAGMTFISATPGSGSCPAKPTANSTTGPGNNTVTCNLGAININAQRTVTIRMRPNPGLQGATVTNSVAVSTTTPDANMANNSFLLNTNIAAPQVNLLVNMTDSVDPLPLGDSTVYRITVTNSGQSVATDVTVTDDMPSGQIAYLGHDVPADGSCGTLPTVGVPGGRLICTFPRLDPGESRVIEVTARGLSKGVPVNRVEVASEETRLGLELDLADNVATQPTTLRTRADVEVVSKTASPAIVNLRESFDFRIDLRNIAGVGLDEADDVVLTDTLPTGIELSGVPSVSVISGTASSQSCTGLAGATGFSCTLGTLSSGAQIRVTAPSRVVSVASTGQVFTNTASITTSSFEANTANNSNSGTVTVNASSLSGSLFRDFDDDAAMDGGDSGIGGVSVTLGGTAFDGAPVTRTVQTATDGGFAFAGLPAGTYSLSHAAIGETHLQDGATTAGSAGGSPAPAAIGNIVLPAATPAMGYLFPKVPLARIGIAKYRSGGPVTQADGSFIASFGLIVLNPSIEPLEDIAITDPLAGAAPSFGSFAALANPASDPLAPGSYTIVSAPSGGCGGANGGFDGASDDVVAGGFSLAAGAQCSLGFQIRVRPVAPLPAAQASGGIYENSARAEGRGALSGQTKAGNPGLADSSNDGMTAQPGVASPTPLTPVLAPSLVLVKAADTSALSSPPAAEEVITYSLTVTNTGNVALANVAVTDAMLGAVAGSPMASLAPGASRTLTAAYALTQADLDAGEVRNTAAAKGEAPDGSTVEDISGPDAASDDPTVVTLTAHPSIALVKAGDVSALSSPARTGDRIDYHLTVTNTGNVSLTNVAVTDPMLGAIAGSPIAALAPGASRTLTAVYQLVQADLDAGTVENTASAEGEAPAGGKVTDISGATQHDDQPTVTSLASQPAIALVKTADLSGVSLPAAIGERIVYSLTVGNTGNITLTNVAVTDPMLGAVAGSPVASLAPGAWRTLTATYALTQADLDAGVVENSARAEADAPGGVRVTDISGTDAGNDDPTVATLTARPSIALVKTADGSGISAPAAVGDRISYGFTVTNTGIVTLRDIALTDALPGIELTGGPIAALAPGAVDSTSFTASYRLTQADIDAGEVRNSATVTGTPDSGGPVTDVSGATTGDDDPTVLAIAPEAGIRLVKSLSAIEDANGNGIQDIGDVVRFGFALTNTGNVALRVETIRDPAARVLGGPVTIGAGETDSASFTASHVLTQADLDRGYVENSATVSGAAVRGDGGPIAGPGGRPLRADAISDAGTDPEGRPVADPGATETPDGAGARDGDPGNDPTVVTLTRTAAVELIKSYAGFDDANGNGVEDAGDTLKFAFAIANTGNVALRIDGIDDPGAEVLGGPATIAPGATDHASFAATHVLTDADMRRGHVQNSARVTGHAVALDGRPIRDGTGPLRASDVSDAGTDPEGAALDDPQAVETPDGTGATDGDPTNDPTVVGLGRPEILLRISIIETPDGNGNGIFDAGDRIVYAFTVTNTGNVLLENATIDPASLSLDLPGFSCRPIRLDADESAVLTCTGNRYTVTAGDARKGMVELAATATASSVAGVPVSSEHAVASPRMRVGGLTLAKSADRGTAVVGDLAGYVLELGNDASGIATTTDLVDTLPAGFSYRSGSATIGGRAAEPEIRGGRLIWRGLRLAPGETLRLRIEALVGGGVRPGAHVNRAQAFSPATGLPVTPEATATIRVEADAVFACSTVIGRVFDDLDHDGYHDGEPSRTNLGKGAAAEGAETGLPGVRLVAPDGLAVTTDRHGRFSLPCAALPRDIGANFMLKLDERTLPRGYRPTTENPRMVRLTPGMLTKMNFGAALSQVVRIDLSARAFNGRELHPELRDGLRRLVAGIAAKPSVLRLSYRLAPGEDRGGARARLRQVEAALGQLWPRKGRFALDIETIIETRPALPAGGR